MNATLTWYIGFLLIGLFLIGMEIFIPGGVAGLFGGLALIGAAITGFMVFGPQGGTLSLGLIILLCGVCFYLWLRFFPATPMGKRLILHSHENPVSGAEAGLDSLLGADGVTLSSLHPSGIALFGERRVDVVTDGLYVEANERVRVDQIEGNRIVVSPISSSEESTS